MNVRVQNSKVIHLILPLWLTWVLIATILLVFDGAGTLTAQELSSPDRAAIQDWTPSGFTWITETVDATGGGSPSMVLDEGSRPHIAYESENQFHHTVLSGTTWTKETISPGFGEISLALDDSGNPHVSFGNGSLSYAFFDGSDWNVQPVEPYVGDGLGRNSAIALDPLGKPHITYYGPEPDWFCDFRHAVLDDGGWVTETVVAGGAHGNGVGPSYGLEIDPAGNLHALYSGSPTYAHDDGAGWSTQAILPGGLGGSLDMADDGSLHTSYVAYSTAEDYFRLRYAALVDGSWSVQEVTELVTDTTGMRAPAGFVWPTITSIAVDSLGVPHIAFFNTTDGSTNGFLGYATYNGSEWVVDVVDSENGSGWGRVSIAVDPSGYPRIAYPGGEWSSDKLRYATVERPSVTVDPSAASSLTPTGADGLVTVIDIPAGAVADTTELVFTERDFATSLPGGLVFAGQGIQLEAYTAAGTHLPDYAFSTPVTITVEYSEGDLGLGGDDDLVIRYWNGATWSDEGLVVIDHDAEANRVTFSTAHLSYFALLGQVETVFIPVVLR